MKSLRLFATAFLLLVMNSSFAAEPNFQKIFQGKGGCFILYDLEQHKTVIKYNPHQCKTRFFACSTFKIPLTLIAYDLGIFQNENTLIKWDGVNRDFPIWNQDQTPKSYLQYSAVWVSQWLTPQIGMPKIKQYLADFNYGNQNMSGGITQAWLSSSLKISADEQAVFLARLWQNKLTVSFKALALTKKSIYAENLPNGDILQGKTGTGFLDGRNNPHGRYLGWFVGYYFHNNRKYVVVTNYIDLKSDDIHTNNKAKFVSSAISAGEQAKIYAKEVLAQSNGETI